MPVSHNVTNKILFGYHKEIESLQGSVLFQMFFSRFKDFDKHNGGRINSIYDGQYRINKEFHKTDEEGKLVFDLPDESGRPQPILLEGKTKEEYEKAFNDFMDEMTVVTWP